MASGRSLGGGRILGSGRSLSPAVSPAPPQHNRNISLLSPSESSVSLSSQTSGSPAAILGNQDIVSRVSAEHPDNVATASASSRLVCPICNEQMVTLLQLNRHLDDVHQNLEEIEQDEVKTWFRAQMTKAKLFQPLAVINQKLKGLDVFESNEAPSPPLLPASNVTSAPATQHVRPDPDEVVTRIHWQMPGNQDLCSELTCGKRLGSVNGSVNCRKCGKLFCEEHTMYQMKLSRSAQHEPVRGFWCRVCETCYKTREGYIDHRGASRDHTENFSKIRRRNIDKAHLEISRLEKRLTRLTQLLANPPADHVTSGGLLWPITGAKAQLRRQLEQSVIDWEEDSTISQCPFCQQEFSNYAFRRHHCRLCGRVVCGDQRTECSTEIGLNVAANSNASFEKPIDQINIDVRMCRDCKHTLFSKDDFDRESAHIPPIQRAYQNLTEFEHGIRLLLPRFQKLLIALQNPESPPTTIQLHDATKVRKRLMEAFGQFDTAARRIRDMPTDSPAHKRLQKAVYQQAYNFLSLHMLPLKSLPKLLKHASPNGLNPQKIAGSARTNGALAGIKFSDNGANSAVSSSSAISSMEAEEKQLRERLIVLEEQKFFVSEMVADASKRRKFDEVSALAQNVEDLNREIDQINGQLSQLDFASAYQKDLASP